MLRDRPTSSEAKERKQVEIRDEEGNEVFEEAVPSEEQRPLALQVGRREEFLQTLFRTP